MRLLSLFVCAALALAQDPAALFGKHCAACHRADSAVRAPLPEALAAMSADAVLRALESGSMKANASGLTSGERAGLARHIGKGIAETASAKGACAAGEGSKREGDWNGWGVDGANTRHAAVRVAKWELAWAFGFPGALAAIAQPSVVGGRVYVGSWDGTVHVLDAVSGCTYWTYKADATVRAAITVAEIRPGVTAALLGDLGANVYALDARSGALLWRTKAHDHPLARVTGAPKLARGRLFVPLSSTEEMPAANPSYPCCTFRGAVVALDASSGKQAWRFDTVSEPAKPVRKAPNGVDILGPAGVGVWSSPTIDESGRVLYIGTGNSYTGPAEPMSNSVIAISMDTGERLWHKQLSPGDAWNAGCMGGNRAVCAETPGPDHDIGASPILVRLASGKRTLIVGQKSGMVYGLDPDAKGAELWRARAGEGSMLGGVLFGMAADARTVFVPVADASRPKPGGLVALDVASGERRWAVEGMKPACAGTRGCTDARMAPVTSIDGAVLSGAMDGLLRAYGAADGKVLWEFDTRRAFDTVNGVTARGGSMNGTGPVFGAGVMLVNSGYGVLGGLPGNVLLAFRAKE